MTGIALALVWFLALGLALLGLAAHEARGRLIRRPLRRELAASKRDWGSQVASPPADYLPARILAEAARLVRSRTVVPARSLALRRLSRIGSCIALATGLALVPFAGTWGGAPDGLPWVVVDLENGLLVLALVMLLAGSAQVAAGLAERSVWSRLASVQVATRSLGCLGLLVLVLAPLALESGSLRLSEIVLAQEGTFSPFAWLPAQAQGAFFERARHWGWPDWNLFSQPITALLFAPAVSLLIRQPLASGRGRDRISMAGFALDSDPAEAHWMRFESRLSHLLVASLFVSLFLGAGSIPYVSPEALVRQLEPYAGQALPSLGVAIAQLMVFALKGAIVLGIAAALRRATASIREDQWLRVVTRRLLPLAWANLLLLSALTLLADSLAAAASVASVAATGAP